MSIAGPGSFPSSRRRARSRSCSRSKTTNALSAPIGMRAPLWTLTTGSSRRARPCGAFSIVHRHSLPRKAATASPSSPASGNRRRGMWASLHRPHPPPPRPPCRRPPPERLVLPPRRRLEGRGEAEGGGGGLVPPPPQPPAVSLDDGAADRQSHADVVCLAAGCRVPQLDADRVWTLPRRADGEPAGALGERAPRLDGGDHEGRDDLLG